MTDTTQIPQLDRVASVLAGLSAATLLEIYRSLLPFDGDMIAAAIAHALQEGGGGSQPVPDPGNPWVAETPVTDGYRIAVDLADSPTGVFLGVFEVRTAGTTDISEPTWRTGLGGEFVVDNDVVWQYIGQIGRWPIALVGAPIEYLAAGELQVGARGTVQGDGVADTAQRSTVYGDGVAVASLSGYAGTGSVDVDSSGTVAGDGAVDASATAQVGGNGNTSARTNAKTIGDGNADAYATAQVNTPITGVATSGFKSLSGGDVAVFVGIIATADALGMALKVFGVPEADPHIDDAVWWDSGVLTKSAGTP